MSSKPHSAAIIGLGFIGGGDQVSGDNLGQQVTSLDGTHVGALSANPSVQLLAGSSRDPGRRERFTARTDLPTYADWRAMLDEHSPEIVSVATYAPVHAEITEACARSGVKVVYCEKPIADRLCDADRMKKACDEAGTLLVINHNRRFSDNFRRLRSAIADGHIGELTSVSTAWGSGRLGNVGTHIFDAVHMVTGKRTVAASGTLDTAGRPDCRGNDFHDPGGWGVLRLSDDLMATVDAPDYGKQPCKIEINGSEGRAVVLGHNVRLEDWDGNVEEWIRPPDAESSMDCAIREIARWLSDGTPPEPTAEEAVHVLEAITAFHVSHSNNGTWVPLPLEGTNRDHLVNSG